MSAQGLFHPKDFSADGDAGLVAAAAAVRTAFTTFTERSRKDDNVIREACARSLCGHFGKAA